jgi:hypothetical protein
MLDVILIKTYVHMGKLSVIPFSIIDGEKQPAVGKGSGVLDPYRTAFPLDNELERWFNPTPAGEGHSYVAIVCGSISRGSDLLVGGLEMLDFDTKNDRGGRNLTALYDQEVEARVPGLLKRLVIEKSRSGGRHIYYRCSTIQGNQKLARLPKEKIDKNEKEKFLTLIETRGESGFSVCAPSDGYSLIQGDLTAIPVITADERAVLLEVARSFNECDEDGKCKPVNCPPKSPADVSKAIGHFNEKGDVRPFLEKHGWTFLKTTRPTRTAGAREHIVCRPGATHGSATFNGEYLYVFSTNADPFQAERAYTKGAVFAYLECGKDFREAAKRLKQMGFGQQRAKIVAERHLSERYEFRKNIIKTKYEYRKLPNAEWMELQSDLYHQFCMEIIKDCDVEMDAKSVRTPVISLAMGNEYDPFVDYFTHLPLWDGHDHIADLAETVTLARPDFPVEVAGCKTEKDFWKESLKRWLTAMVATAIRYEKDEQISNQSVLVLIGPQGKKKTTWFRSLISLPHRAEYIHEGAIDPNNKDERLHLSTKILICPEELSNKYDIRDFKRFVTSEFTNDRKAYDYEAETRVRRASIAAGGNEVEFLFDHTGNRRWLCFQVNDVNMPTVEKMHLVYAQVMSLLQSGYQYWFDEASEISRRNLMFRANSEEFEWLVEFFETKPAEGLGKWLQPMKIGDEIEKMTGKTCNRIKLGFALSELEVALKHDTHGRKLYLLEQKAFPGALNLSGYNLQGKPVRGPGALNYTKD